MPISSVTELIKSLKESSLYAKTSVSADTNTIETRKDDIVPTNFGGDVTINDISIITKGGEKISLVDVYAGLVVEENIFSMSIHGAVRIHDVYGGLEKFLLTGGERMTIKISKPNNADVLIWREDLIVTKIGPGNHDDINGGTSYNLHFTSNSFVQSMKKNLFKSYKNKPIAEAVVEIYKEMSTNDLFIEDPKITLSNPFISTGFYPHRAIDYLAQRSCTKDKFFVFFERFVPVYGSYPDGLPFSTAHYFGSIEKLIEDSNNNPVQTIYFLSKNDALREKSIIRGINFQRKENFDHMSAMKLGLYNTTISAIDPIARTVTKQKLSYTDNNQQTKDFYGNKLLEAQNIFSIYDDVINQTPGRKVIVGSINDSVPREDWVKNHIFGQLTRKMFRVSIDIQGATNQIAVGHVVNLFIPSSLERIVNPNSKSLEVDRIHSGKYIVHSVTHTITENKYTKTLQLSRSSLPTNLNRPDLKSFDLTELVDFASDIVLNVVGNRRTGK